MQHLWEIKHPYYCNEGNYCSGDAGGHHKTWAEFAAGHAALDLDMNLVFRWDWHEDGDDGGFGGSKFTEDVNYRNGYLQIFWMGQRKGYFWYTTIDVCRADEPAVIEFLKPRLEHMKKLWEPLA